MSGDLYAIASALCFAIANVTIVRGAARGDDDNGAFLSLLLTAGISAAGWVMIGLARGFDPITWRAIAWFAGAGIFTSFIGRVFLFASVQRLGAMRGSAMKRFNPFFAVILGVAVLGERLSAEMVAGIALILASFALLVKSSLRGAGRVEDASASITLRTGYILAILSGLGYASGYLFRKMGLAAAPDAWLGAAVGSIVGAALFVFTGAFNDRYRRAVRATFRRPNSWLVCAGISSSFGQVFYFAALNTRPISRVALIVSMEVFVTLALAAVFLRKHETLTAPVAIAAALGVAGTAFILNA